MTQSMFKLPARLARPFKRFKRDESGAAATVELVLIYPAILLLMMVGYEISYLSVSQAMLERGLDMAVRDLRLGRTGQVTPAKLASATCEYARYVRNCESRIIVELDPVSTDDWSMPNPWAMCDAQSATSANPDSKFDKGNENELMLVRACIMANPVFPVAALFSSSSTDDGAYPLSANSAFVNEPNI
ncbi:hypothetical protein AQS8620_01358 [Aquimixticola soesokkakensis]|uniref:TadE-like protein n=1 Tax=Aquimixticola soesokkakensis TaxID=1519096 RepID=A0A1Y5SD36_9RHOB|nr:hypothetical protein [Aquimixticola soesokkakensis]SLN37282.1 hypothetical protein AQS8620_01358 [Aquimixticola soesokkakensis]